jgi:hypothetical protein
MQIYTSSPPTRFYKSMYQEVEDFFLLYSHDVRAATQVLLSIRDGTYEYLECIHKCW